MHQIVFMQQMRYNAPDRLYVFQKFSGPPFGAVTPDRAPLTPKSLLRA